MLRMAAGSKSLLRIELGEVDPDTINAIRRANTEQFLKRLQIGVARPVEGLAGTTSSSLRWQSVPGGFAAQWEIASTGAHALRIGLEVDRLPSSAEIRFAGSGDPGTVYGPFGASSLLSSQAVYWSPVLEGERAVVELFLPYPGTAEVEVALSEVSHLFASPSAVNMESLAKAVGDAGACERDLICASATDAALAAVGKAVARMAFSDSLGTYACTGTLLNTTAGPVQPYFYTAAHCIDTQPLATTLTTHWFYDRTGCNTGGTSPSYTQVVGGAALLYANTMTDVSFLRLNASPPSGAIYAGWTADPLSLGTALMAVHHPQADLKKVSLGSMGGFGQFGSSTSDDRIIALWNSTATGVTEPGSSGSGIFTAVGSPAPEYQLRGGLHGGPSSCTASGAGLRDYYSRFDRAYTFVASYLNPATSCTYSISPTNTSVGAAASSGSFGVTTTAGCTWSAASAVTWITTNSSGTGSGTVNYSVAANSGAARAGTITVGGQTFSIAQQAGGGTAGALANGDFESGTSSWVQSATSGAAIITNDSSTAHSGNYYARLGGYLSGTDILYQDVSIPVGAAQATLQFWYRIQTAEPAMSPAWDTMVVSINSVTGATLATVATFTNQNATSGWVQSPAYDLVAFAGQTVRLTFTAMNDALNVTSFRVDDIAITVTLSSGTTLSRLEGISTRMGVLTGDNVLIGGFIIGGTSPKTVAVRARGPSLASQGVAGTLADPMLTLVPASGPTVTNDDWQTASNAGQLSAFGLAPSNPKESAILATLNPGAYTAIVSGVGNTNGVAIVEVYEVDHPEAPLIGISTRGQVLTGDNVMIGGFIIQGSTPQTVVVRARGPSLTSQGVAGALQNPTLTLVPASGPTVTNDDWQTAANAAQLSASGFAPTDPRESAILITLNPGAYTAIVSGVGGTTGVAIVEVYAQ
jgi:hypothetical protein